MFFRGTKKDWNESKGDGNRNRLEEIVKAGRTIGILAYDGDEPVGWCAVAPRTEYDALDRSKYYRTVDDIPTWALTCFFTARGYRRKGVSRYLILQAMRYAGDHGAHFLEAYPIIPKKEKVPDIFAYTGFYKEFLDIGFQEIANRDGLHPIVRICLD
jgi:GNAT superfamily N-acetyltransferase